MQRTLARFLPQRVTATRIAWRDVLRVLRRLSGAHARTCPICGFHGYFRAFGMPPRFDARCPRCPRCASLERHRLIVLLEERRGLLDGVTSLLHFAPEEVLRKDYAARFSDYQTSDLFRDDVEFRSNMEATGLPSVRYDALLVSHVLEHVDDRKALPELFRILRPGGRLLVLVPIIEGWEET